MTRNLDVPDEYAALYRVYEDAYEQASEGKGKGRHASEGEAYEDQIICEVARRVGLGYPLGQAAKKIYESQRLGGESGVAELLGAINYIAAAIIVMREGLEPAPKAEGGCFQNGNNHSPEAKAEPEFKHGDKVQFKEHLGVKGWADARYEREHPSGYGHIVYAEGFGRIAVEPENLRPAPKADEEPEFQRGDKVEVQMVPDSSTWASAAIMAVYRDKDTSEWRYCVDFEDGWAHVVVPSARVRPVSAHNAEGCEALVEKDAPQTPAELYDRIIANNPATFKARTPTGEELAEMAEEEGR